MSKKSKKHHFSMKDISKELNYKNFDRYLKQQSNEENLKTFYTAAIAALDREIMQSKSGKGNFSGAYLLYDKIESKLNKKESQEFEKYKSALGKAGHRLIKENLKSTNKNNKKDEEIIDYYNKHSKLEKGLARSITAVSLSAILASLLLGVGSVTGNIISEYPERLYGLGGIVFILGLMGILLISRNK